MRIRLLGTGAADGIPGWLADSEVARYARSHGGKDVRTRAAAILDGHFKIDLPPDTYAQLLRDGLDALDWTGLVFTHSHDDHLAVEEIQYGLYPFNDNEALPYTIYGNAAVCSRVRQRFPGWPIEIVETRSFEPFVHMGFDVVPIRAKHGSGEDAQNLLFVKEGRTLLYATDTGIWDDETWRFLRATRLDALVIECTHGFSATYFEGHLDVAECKSVVRRLREDGILSVQSRVVTTHHSHQGGGTHRQLEEALADKGIQVGYDGMEFDV